MTSFSAARRGIPGDFAARLARAEKLLGNPGGAAGPLALLTSVLGHQAARGRAVAPVAAAAAAGAEDRMKAGRFPLLDLDLVVAPIADEIEVAVRALASLLPGPLAAAGQILIGASPTERKELVDAWLEEPCGPEAIAGFWARVAAGPILEVARAAIDTPGRDDWQGAACPACGGAPQVSVIAEETGEFMGGSPRSLVCGRCAGWWSFSRAMCAWCSESDPNKLPGFFPDDRKYARIDRCDTCTRYIKTFDLRQPGAGDVVPLVDDVATVALDLWAQDQGLSRPLVSFAGV